MNDVRSLPFRRWALCGSFFFLFAHFGPAHAQTAKHYEIAGGDLRSALQQFARQSDQQILYTSEVAGGRRTRGFRGDASAVVALSRLLEGTGLTFRNSDSGTLMIFQNPVEEALRAGPQHVGSPAAPRVLAPAPAAQLEEVVVTATRRLSTVNRVPLSITALTPRTLAGTGVKNIDQMSRTVVSVTFRRNGVEGNPSIAIRGIVSTLGSPTTGVYIDDTPIQKRDLPGVTTGNGTPFPQMFDLERVEVLRGPQGTLYGSSAEGGAVRFITPAPSLTTMSGFGRVEVSTTQGGGPSYEAGVAAGGPIQPDRLGFRASIWSRHTGGYMDHVSIYDGRTFGKDTNWGDSWSGRLAVTWAPTPGLKITPALFMSYEHFNDSDIFWEDVPQFTSNAGYFTNRGSVNGVSYNFPDKFYPGGTFGPYNQFGPGKNGYGFFTDEKGGGDLRLQPRTTTLTLPTLTMDYDFGVFGARAITSYSQDSQIGNAATGPSIRSPAVLPTTTSAGFVTVASHTAEDQGSPVTGGAGYVPLALPGFPQQFNVLYFNNHRTAITQEIRLFSTAADRRLSWVAGLYFSDSKIVAKGTGVSNTDAMSIYLRGVPEQYFLGNFNLNDGIFTVRNSVAVEREMAAFGEATYALMDRLSITAGLRASRVTFRFNQAVGGSPAGVPPGFVASPLPPAVITSLDQPNHAFSAPGEDSYTRFGGRLTEAPVNPKFALSYNLADSDLVYVSAAKGYRGGGVNQPAPAANCAADLAALNLTDIGTPITYKSDSVWSYEAGAKLRLFDNRAQINSSVYQVNWQDPQLAVRLRCSATYVTNAGAARSRGFDVQAQFRLFGGLTLEGAAAYTKARYTKDFIIPGPSNTTSIIVAKGDSLGVPEWQFTLSPRYNFSILGGLPGYVRFDYQFSGKYYRGAGPGRVGYDPLIYDGDATHYLSARAGVGFRGWNLAVFGNNLGDSQERLFQQHATGFALVTASTFRPREFGVQATYRY